MPDSLEPNPDVQRLIDAVNKAGVRQDCPMCGHHDWSVFQNAALIPKSGRSGTPSAIEGNVAVAFACLNCGFVRLHSATELDRLMDPREHDASG